ncbi:fasciclin domain-containing protein [Mesorhizobium sp. L2C084A000]|uniref:fasciclin domain-containing protein n=1 Tax=Mesorhizobium sp. L2C084A000 TaxID=1287116 RepID=UPI0003D03396|nr:fasciclin domain-containing protein [Mesorhizobium sp. L2C084A000]ESZ28746.1 fasciclin [Mesorhizobium sp. L2C084A000]
MKRRLIFAVCILISQVAVGNAQTVETAVARAQTTSDNNIIQNAALSKDYTTLIAAVKAAGLVETLEGKGPFTVLAPTDAAFARLQQGAVQVLLAPEAKNELSKILKCHVISGDLSTDAILAEIAANNGAYSVDTIGGCSLTFRAAGSNISVTDQFGDIASLVASDVKQTNGLVYAVDKVLSPGAPDTSHEIHASRIFAGPNEYPPTNFAAYGILAFKSKVTIYDQERQKMLCEAFVNAVLPSSSLVVPTAAQMVTVWPMDSAEHAKAATNANITRTCDEALQDYGLAVSQKAVRDAVASGVAVDGDGPFLIAWAPPTQIGKPGAVVLKADLSTVTEYKMASDIMHRWVVEIENRPELWRSGTFDRSLIATAREWADHYGSLIFSVVGVK